MPEPHDINGRIVRVGTRVRLISLSGRWLEDLPADERTDVMSMVGEIFEIEEIDEYGQPWVRKSWPDISGEKCHSHSIALEARDMEIVEAQEP
jgi:hypothetical protein